MQPSQNAPRATLSHEIKVELHVGTKIYMSKDELSYCLDHEFMLFVLNISRIFADRVIKNDYTCILVARTGILMAFCACSYVDKYILE